MPNLYVVLLLVNRSLTLRDSALAHVTHLTSLGPRPAHSKPNVQAAEYIIAQLTKIRNTTLVSLDSPPSPNVCIALICHFYLILFTRI